MSIEAPDSGENEEKKEKMRLDYGVHKDSYLKEFLTNQALQAEKDWREYSEVVREMRKGQINDVAKEELERAEAEYFRLFDIYKEKQLKLQKLNSGEKNQQ